MKINLVLCYLLILLKSIFTFPKTLPGCKNIYRTYKFDLKNNKSTKALYFLKMSLEFLYADDPCKNNPCDISTSFCKSDKGHFKCQCKPGFYKKNKTSFKCEGILFLSISNHSVILEEHQYLRMLIKLLIVDINECTTQLNVCDPISTICSNSIGSFFCVCKDGFHNVTYPYEKCSGELIGLFLASI